MIQQTSMEAYWKLKPILSDREQWVLEGLKNLGGEATSSEIMAHLGIHNPNTVRPRLTALREHVRIEKAGRRVCRCSGRSEIVWRMMQL